MFNVLTSQPLVIHIPEEVTEESVRFLLERMEFGVGYYCVPIPLITERLVFCSSG